MSARVAVVGVGYVGLSLAVQVARSGHDVVGLDASSARIGAIRSGAFDADHPVASAPSRLDLTSDPSTALRDAEVVVVCVPTPLVDGVPDHSAIVAAARAVHEHIGPDTLVVLESTSHPGTTDELFAPIVAGDRFVVGEDVFVAYSPERTDPGNGTYTVENTPKVVAGVTPRCRDRALAFYGTVVRTTVPAAGTREAELGKLIENTFRLVNLALVNELTPVAHALGIDIWEAIDVAATKPFGFMAFQPGVGVGGHCIPVDPVFLNEHVHRRLGRSIAMIDAATSVNASAPSYVAERARALLPPVDRMRRCLVLGVTYKPDVADTRESPVAALVAALHAGGDVIVEYHDPHVPEWGAPGLPESARRSVADVTSACGAVDLVVVAQRHSSYDVDAILTQARAVLDATGTMDGPHVVRL